MTDKDKYKIREITDSSIAAMISDTKVVIERIRKEISRLEEEIKKGNNEFENNTDEKAVWWLCNVLQMEMSEEQEKINAPKFGESYYQWFIPTKYESYIGTDKQYEIQLYLHRNSDHVHDESISDRMECFSHPNIRVNTIFNDSDVVSGRYKVNGLPIMLIRRAFPSQMLKTNENAIALLKCMLYLYKEGRYGDFKRNIKKNESVRHITQSDICRIVESAVRECLNRQILAESNSHYTAEEAEDDGFCSFDDGIITLPYGEKFAALYSVTNGYDTYHLGVDDGCYVIFKENGDGISRPSRSSYITPSLMRGLKTLPVNPRKNKSLGF